MSMTPSVSFRRWNILADKLAVWQSEPGRFPGDPIDIVVFQLTVQTLPFTVTATSTNITSGKGWIETSAQPWQ